MKQVSTLMEWIRIDHLIWYKELLLSDLFYCGFFSTIFSIRLIRSIYKV